MKYLNQKKPTNSEYQSQNIYPSIFAVPSQGMTYTVNINQEFGDCHTFDEVISLLNVATPDDLVIFNINSCGGQLFSLIALKNAIKMSMCQIEMRLLGEASSAASALFLTDADRYIVGENSMMMIHNMICGTGYSDTYKIIDRAKYNEKMNDRFVKETYKDFLTDKEIESVLNGKEIYLEDFEIEQRLNDRTNKRVKEFNQTLQNATNVDYVDWETEDLEVEIALLQDELKSRKKVS